MSEWEIERGEDGLPIRMWWAGPTERAVGKRMGPHIVTKTGWLMAKDARAILWRIACAERRGQPWDAMRSTDPDVMDALEKAGLVEGTGEIGYYRLTPAGRRELP